MKTIQPLTSRFSCALAAALLLAAPATSVSAADLHLGLVSYWPMDTDLGGVTPDLAFGNDMITTDNPALVAGQRGQAFSFNGTSQFLSRTHDTSPENDGMPIYLSPAGYTISLWVKGLPQAASRSFFCMGNNANNTPLVWIETDPTANGDKLGFFLRTTSGTAIVNHTKSTSVVLDDAWHHIAWVDDQGSVALYVDGVRDGANFNYVPAAAGSFLLNYTTIGALARGTAANYFTGAIDEVALWERPLTPEEVEQVRTSGIATPIPASAPQFLRPLADSEHRLGDRAVFSVAAVGSHPLTYEWSRDGVAVPDQTGNTLTLTDLTTVGTAQIKVNVSNPEGTTSGSASLIVTEDPAPDVRSGLISHWPMDEVTGVPATTPDLYSRNDMAVVNMDASNLSDTPLGKALTFDGVEECGNRLEGYPIYDNRTYSISMWVKGAPQNNRGVLGEGSLATSTPLIAFLTESTGFLDNLVMLIRNDAGTALLNSRRSTRPVFDDQWHHLVWTDENGLANLYVDGVLDETDFSYTRTGTFTLNTTSVGALVRNAIGNYFAGSIDDLAQWNRRLTWTEIQQIRADGIPAPAGPLPPEILQEPGDLTVDIYVGDTVSFSVRANGTKPLQYQWLKDGTPIPPASNPSAATDVLTLANVQFEDSGGYSAVISNAAGSLTSRVAPLLVSIPYTPVTSGDVLKLDFGLTGSPEVQAGFREMTLAQNGSSYDGVKVTVAPIGGATVAQIQERLRVADAIGNNPPAFTQAQLYNDLIFVNNTTDGTGMSILIERLAPNTTFGVTFWSWTTQAASDRISDWIETASGTPVPVTTGYVFNTLVPPLSDYDATFGGLVTSSASGKLQFEGRKNGGSGQSVLINAMHLVAQPAIRITDARVADGTLRLAISAQYPGQPISLEESADLPAGSWSPAAGGGVIETHGPIAIAEFPASAQRRFYRAISQ